MFTYKQYPRGLSGWYSNAFKTKLWPVPADAVYREDAIAAGFRPHQKVQEPSEYLLVMTSFNPGFRGISARVYVSIWAR